VFRLELEKWPPSTNKLYTVWRNRKILSKEGMAYHNYVKFAVAQAMPPVIEMEEACEVHFLLYRPDWTNRGWPGKAKTRYKKIDLTNRLKCVEDALAESLAIDDSQFFDVITRKCKGTEKIVIEVLVKKMPFSDGSTIPSS